MRQSKSNQTTHIFIDFQPKPMNIILHSSVSGLTNIIQIYLSVPMNLKIPMNKSLFFVTRQDPQQAA
jgi:hypothetical protein